jgi:hypothetical protein
MSKITRAAAEAIAEAAVAKLDPATNHETLFHAALSAVVRANTGLNRNTTILISHAAANKWADGG